MLQRFTSRVRALVWRRARARLRARAEIRHTQIDSGIDPYEAPQMAVVA
jgi:hypothetical protein